METTVWPIALARPSGTSSSCPSPYALWEGQKPGPVEIPLTVGASSVIDRTEGRWSYSRGGPRKAHTLTHAEPLAKEAPQAPAFPLRAGGWSLEEVPSQALSSTAQAGRTEEQLYWWSAWFAHLAAAPWGREMTDEGHIPPQGPPLASSPQSWWGGGYRAVREGASKDLSFELGRSSGREQNRLTQRNRK